MRFIIIFFVTLFFIGCNHPADNTVDRSIIEPIPLTPLQTAVHDSLINIMTKDIELSGNIVKSIKIEGMEIIKISRKDYYINEMKEQETAFNNYLQYMSKFSKTTSPINNPQQLEVSKAKHNAVMAYLKKAIKTASSNPELYKVVYYLKADASNINYNQLQTTFLDKEFKKMVADYSFLR